MFLFTMIGCDSSVESSNRDGAGGKTGDLEREYESRGLLIDPYQGNFNLVSAAESTVVGIAVTPRYQADEQLIEQYDEDGDGDLIGEELHRVAEVINQSGELENRIKSLTNNLDLDHNGTVDPYEVKSFLKLKRDDFHAAMEVLKEENLRIKEELRILKKEPCSKGKNGLEQSGRAQVKSDEEVVSCKEAKDIAKEVRFTQMEKRSELIGQHVDQLNEVLSILKSEVDKEILDNYDEIDDLDASEKEEI